MILHDLSIVFAACLLFLLPGLTLLLWLLPDRGELDWFEWLSLSAGLSLAAFPLLLLWTRTLGGIRLGPVALWAILGICLLLVAWGVRRHSEVLGAVRNPPRAFSLLLLLTAGVVLGVRLWAVRGLSFPLWGDSYQHTVMAQLIVDHGGLFDSWLPYVPLKTFTYHYGFHTAAAFLYWLTGLQMPRAVLLVGQLLNALAIFTLYPLAVRLTENRWAGLMTVLVAGLLSPMPGYYLNWGRYTQLAGQVILPVALWLTWEMGGHPHLNWRWLVLALVAVAGLALTHYRVILFYAVILPGWWLVHVVLSKKRQVGWWRSLGRIALLATLALLFIAPWLANVAFSRLAQMQISIAKQGSTHPFIRNEYNRLGDVRFFVPTPLLGLTGLGFLLSFARRRSLAFFIALWIGALFLLANPYLLRLPGTGVVNNFAVLISLYMPVAIVAGYGVVSAIEYARSRWSGFLWAAGLLIVGASLWGARAQARMVDPSFMMVTPADERAMAWIRANTPLDAKFLVNGFFAYGGSVVVGADAGWWIPLLTGRENTMPPLTYASETPYSPDYPRQVKELVRQIQANDLSTPEGLALLQQNGVTHIYIGRGEGRVGNPGEPLLLAETLLAAPYYEPVYHEDRVWIFAVQAQPAETPQ